MRLKELLSVIAQLYNEHGDIQVIGTVFDSESDNADIASGTLANVEYVVYANYTNHRNSYHISLQFDIQGMID